MTEYILFSNRLGEMALFSLSVNSSEDKVLPLHDIDIPLSEDGLSYNKINNDNKNDCVTHTHSYVLPTHPHWMF